MVEVPSGREHPITWDELVEVPARVTEDWEAMEEYRKKVGIEIH